jgi:hypothetical protein
MKIFSSEGLSYITQGFSPDLIFYLNKGKQHGKEKDLGGG